mmetsp:Transcript_9074/g.22732  ORF Transcript_9074/g.22732 Transcript_9074/m.22732 type:complete len:246 (-) Transcript_9074:235-972(-)
MTATDVAQSVDQHDEDRSNRHNSTCVSGALDHVQPHCENENKSPNKLSSNLGSQRCLGIPGVLWPNDHGQSCGHTSSSQLEDPIQKRPPKRMTKANNVHTKGYCRIESTTTDPAASQSSPNHNKTNCQPSCLAALLAVAVAFGTRCVQHYKHQQESVQKLHDCSLNPRATWTRAQNHGGVTPRIAEPSHDADASHSTSSKLDDAVLHSLQQWEFLRLHEEHAECDRWVEHGPTDPEQAENKDHQN